MRKAILLIAGFLFACTLTTQAQTERGRFVIGANSNYSLTGMDDANFMSIGFTTVKYKSDEEWFEEQDPDKTISFNFIPKFGFFAANNLLIGLDFCAAFQSTEDGIDGDTYSNTLLSTGPFVRYYIPTSYIKPFFELSGAYGNVRYKYPRNGDTEERNYQLTSFGGGFGVAFPIGNNASFDLLAHYTSMSQKRKEDNEENFKSVTGTIGLKFGFVVFLGN